MSKNLARQFDKNLSGGWDAAISDAEKQIEAARNRISALTFSVKTFRELRDSGAAFPGEEKPKRRSKRAKRDEVDA